MRLMRDPVTGIALFIDAYAYTRVRSCSASMRSAQSELIQNECVLFNGTQLNNHPINIKSSSALFVCARVVYASSVKETYY
jgi:hypothetical protein